LLAADQLAIADALQLRRIRHGFLLRMRMFVLHPYAEAQRGLRIIALIEKVAVLAPRSVDEITGSGRLIRIVVRRRRYGERETIERRAIGLKFQRVMPRRKLLGGSSEHLVLAQFPQTADVFDIPDVSVQDLSIST